MSVLDCAREEVLTEQATEYVVRPYVPADYPAVLALWQSEGRNPYTEQEIARLLRAEGGALVAEKRIAGANSKVVGVLLWSHNGRVALLWRLAVAASCRRQGLATRLMQQAEQDIRQAGFKRIGLLVMEANAGAKALYTRHEWEPGEGVETWWKNLPESAAPEPAACTQEKCC